ncbi:MAG TPA: hypothetical protein VHH36_09740 [Candidatus Thermoplasmatota archaeon]|nr:hypothetical protein [Candidatus Thermoplasmatota archaeon]
MVFRAIRRIFGKSHEGPAGVSPDQAEIRLKALKARLAKNKSEAKRLYSEVEKTKNLSPERKAEAKTRLKALETDRKEILAEMKALHRRLPKR